MSIYDYQQAFGAWDKTSRAMRQAVGEWFDLYYGTDQPGDPCQRVAYSVVSKLVKTVFGEYRAQAKDPVVQGIVDGLGKKRKEAMQLALVGGECYLKPCPGENGFGFTLIPRNNVLVFGRDIHGVPTDVGCVERSVQENFYYTLLERRTVDAQGYLTIENRLYRSLSSETLGAQVALSAHPEYEALASQYRYGVPVGSVGLVRLKTPMVNCVDGSADGVAVYAPAVGVIRAIDENEAQLAGEFRRGESRIITSADILGKDKSFSEHLFVGLDEDVSEVGITVFSPALREQSYLARKQEYLRNVESIIGLKRGMLSDSNVEDRTATEIASSAGDYNLTVIDFQQMWEQALAQAIELCGILARLYKLAEPTDTTVSIDWGNGVLYDEDKVWEQYVQMVNAGLIKPEIALGWRFNMPTETPADLAKIREKFMPSTP